MVKFKEMNLLELSKYWNTEWAKDEPALDDSTVMRDWESAVTANCLNASGLEILQSLHELRESEYVEQTTKMRDSFFEEFAWEFKERLDSLEASVKVLLYEHRDEPSKITIGQLNNLKGGLRE